MPLPTLSQTQSLMPERPSWAQEAAQPASAQRTELPQSTYRSDPSSERPLALHSNPQSLKLLKKSSISRIKRPPQKYCVAHPARLSQPTPLRAPSPATASSPSTATPRKKTSAAPHQSAAASC